MRKKGFTIISRACNGFTIIELLVVITIIGILSALGIAGFLSSQAAGRDSRRLGDISNIMVALQRYYTDCNFYPRNNTNPDNQFVSSTNGTWIQEQFGACSAFSGTGAYMDKVSQDPVNSGCQMYEYRHTDSAGVDNSATGYELRYTFETTDSSKALGVSDSTCGGYARYIVRVSS